MLKKRKSDPIRERGFLFSYMLSSYPKNSSHFRTRSLEGLRVFKLGKKLVKKKKKEKKGKKKERIRKVESK